MDVFNDTFFSQFLAKCAEIAKGETLWTDPFPPLAEGEMVISELTKEELIHIQALDYFNSWCNIVCSGCRRGLPEKTTPHCKATQQIRYWLPILRQLLVTMISDRLQIDNNLFAIRRGRKIVQTKAEMERNADLRSNFQCPPDE